MSADAPPDSRLGTGLDASPTPPVLDALEVAWRRSDALFDTLAAGALYARPIPLRHPFVFYLGHLPAFAWNQVARGVLGEPGFHPEFDLLFERGIDPGDAAAAAAVSVPPDQWPPPDEIRAYRDQVRQALRDRVQVVQARPSGDPLSDGLRVYHLVLEHELMHQETLLYLLAELSDAQKRRPVGAPEPVTGPAPSAEAVAIPAGRITLGAHFDAIAFGWDNEFPPQTVSVDRFAVDRHPVSVEAFRGFVEGGGYADPQLWDPAGWAWVQAEGRARPHRWVVRDGTLHHRTLYGSLPLDTVGGWPALVTAAEAEAFCRWSDARLPTEAELHRAAYGSEDGGPRAYPWGDAAPAPAHGNFGFHFDDPTPVGHHPAGDSAFGVGDLLGNAWEWTATPFLPRPGFHPWMRTYPGYSADFFDGEHRVLFGGSSATDPRLLRRSLRNWFRPRYPWVFATFRRVW